MIDTVLILILGVALIGYAFYRAFFMSYYDKCYAEMESRGVSVFGSCYGQMGGGYETNYLSYSCIDCPYFVETIDGKGRKDDKNENPRKC